VDVGLLMPLHHGLANSTSHSARAPLEKLLACHIVVAA
jgi:hypothetical protein